MQYQHKLTPSNELALSITLSRLSCSGDWSKHCERFGRSEAYLSTVFADVTTYIAETFAEQLRWHHQLNDYERLRTFARALKERGCPSAKVWGFVDSHFTAFSRSEEQERAVHTGFYHTDGFKVQAITTPDGLISSLSGPYTGNRNDWLMWNQSEVTETLRQLHFA